MFVTAFTTMLHAVTSQTVDVVLALYLIIGGVIGAQIGTRLALRLKAEQLRVLLAGMVLAVCAKVALELVVQPQDLFALSDPGRH